MSKVSIIIPAYNQASFLSQTIESCLAQTHVDTEILVVDDGSTDQTADIARQFGDRIRYVRQENEGLPGARNRGYRESTGDYICFLDSDDYYAPTKIAKQAALLDANTNLAFVYCDIVTVNERGEPVSDAGKISDVQRPLSGNLFSSLLMGGFFPPHTVMIRKEVLESVGLFDPELGGYADYDLWLRVSGTGAQALFQSEPLAFYRIHAGSMSKDGEHMAKTQLGALTKAAGDHPGAVAKGVCELQKASEELFHANRWLKAQWATALGSLHAMAPQEDGTSQSYQLLKELSQARLTKGGEEQKAVWDVTLEHITTKALFLQPPAELLFVLPTARKGHLRTAVMIHPDAWTKPGAGGCEFHVRVDGRIAHVVALDPIRLTGDRDWHELNITVPENPRGNHRVSLETKSIGASTDFRWALWRAPQFVWKNSEATSLSTPSHPAVHSLNAA